MYQAMKLAGADFVALTADHVIHVALQFEKYLWGQWSKSVMEQGMKDVINEAIDNAMDESEKLKETDEDNVDRVENPKE
jgi:hypothetical protein